MIIENYSSYFNYWPIILITVLLIIVIIFMIIFRKNVIEFFKKNGVFGSIYKLSFLVYICIIVRSLIGGFIGFSFFDENNPVYGFKAICGYFVIYLYLFSIQIPIVPIVALYQMAYAITSKLKMKKYKK